MKLSGAAIGDVTIATTNADGSMRSLSAILADCRVAFGGMTEAEKANNAETLVGKNAMSGFLALMNAAPEDIAKVSGAVNNCKDAAKNMADTMQDNLEGQQGDLVIPVYLGNQLLDEVIVTAQQRMSLRSGGR